MDRKGGWVSFMSPVSEITVNRVFGSNDPGFFEEHNLTTQMV
jgi:hypothetical protein